MQVRDAYVLKNLSSRWAWVGNAVHEAIERILKRIQDQPIHHHLNLDGNTAKFVFAVIFMQVMRDQYRESLSRKYRERPKRRFGLMEHEYEEQVPREEWVRTSEKARAALRSFLDGDVFANIRESDPATWIGIESLGQFHLDDVGVWAVPDFARRVDEKGAELYDWKTGAVKPEKSRLQMACYTLYVEERHWIDPSQLRAYLVYLGKDVQVHEFAFSEEDLDAARDEIRESMSAMRARLDDEATNRAEKEAFPLTDDTSICRFCNYRRLCGR